MNKDLINKLRNSGKIVEVKKADTLYVLMEADGLQPKVYSIVYSTEHGKAIVTEITDPDAIKSIFGI